MVFDDVLTTHYRERLVPGLTSGTGWIVDELAAAFHCLTSESLMLNDGVEKQSGRQARHKVTDSPCWEPTAIWCERWEDWGSIDGILECGLLLQFPELQSLHPSFPKPPSWPQQMSIRHTPPLNELRERLIYLSGCYVATVSNSNSNPMGPSVYLANVLHSFGLSAPLIVWLHLFDEVGILENLSQWLTPPTNNWVDLNAMMADFNEEVTTNVDRKN